VCSSDLTYNNGGVYFSGYVFGKIADGTEDGSTINLTLNNHTGANRVAIGRVYRFSGANAGTFYEDVHTSSGLTDVGLGDHPTISAITTAGANRLAAAFVFIGDDLALGNAAAVYTEALAEYTSATGSDAAIQLQTATIASAGAVSGTEVSIASDAVFVNSVMGIIPA
jgi:hypothetical protein